MRDACSRLACFSYEHDAEFARDVGSAYTVTLRTIGAPGGHDVSDIPPLVDETYTVYVGVGDATARIYWPRGNQMGIINAGDPDGAVDFCFGESVPFATAMAQSDFIDAVAAEIAVLHPTATP